MVRVRGKGLTDKFGCKLPLLLEKSFGSTLGGKKHPFSLVNLAYMLDL